MFVKPAPGVKIRDPFTLLHLPEDGKEVPESSYWLRRLAEGDVVAIASKPVLDVIQIPDSPKAKG